MRPPPIVPPGAEFAFGESPFHVKGVLYLGTQAFFREKVPGGVDALAKTIGGGPLADFITQPFLASSRYDVMPVPALVEHEARTCGQTVTQYLDGRTRWQADRDLHGVYRFLLRLVHPSRVMSRLPLILISMFDFAKVEMQTVGEAERLAVFTRIPAPLEGWLRVGFSVYTERALRHAGAQEVETDFGDSGDEGFEAGLRMRTMRMRVRWT